MLLSPTRPVLKVEPEWVRIHRVADKLEPVLRRRFLAALNELRNKLPLDAIAEVLETGALNDLADIIQTLTVDAQKALAAVSTQAVKQVGELTAAGMGFNFDIKNPQVVRWIDAQTGRLIQGVSQETRTAVRDIIRRGFVEGIAPEAQARHIRNLVGLTARDANTVDRMWQKLVDDGADLAFADRRAAKLTDKFIRRRARNIARTETIRAANMGQQFAWQQAADTGLLNRDQTFRVWIATGDSRTCFPAGTTADTPTGPRSIESLRPGDEVLTPEGPMPVAATAVRRSFEYVAVLDTRGRITVSTPDHEWWVGEWMRADALRPGDVLQLVENQLAYIVGAVKFDIRDSYDAPAFFRKLGVPSPVLARVVPVVSVRLNSDAWVNEGEVNAASPDLVFLHELDTQACERDSHRALDARFAAEGPVARERTKPPVAISWQGAKLETARRAFQVMGRTAARLRTMTSALLPGAKRLAASLASFVQRLYRRAFLRAVHVPVGMRLADGEAFVTYRADLLDVARLAERQIAPATTEPSVLSVVPVRDIEDDAALLADNGTVFASGGVIAASRAKNPTDRLPFADERFTTVVADAIKAFSTWRITGDHAVYDISIAGPPMFYANGVLVHNCPVCAVLDGQTVGLTDNFVSREQATGFEAVGTGGELGTESIFRITGTKPLKNPVNEQTPPAHPSCRCTVGLSFDLAEKREQVAGGGVEIDINRLEDLAEETQAQVLDAVRDMQGRFPVLGGRWESHPSSVFVGQERGLKSLSVTNKLTQLGEGARVEGVAGGKATSDMFVFRGIAEKFKPGGTQVVANSTYDAIVHEMGHAIHFAVGKAPTQTAIGRINTLDALIMQAKRATFRGKRISNYGNTNTSEFFAEMFTARNGRTVDIAPDLASAVEAFAEELNRLAVEQFGVKVI